MRNSILLLLLITTLFLSCSQNQNKDDDKTGVFIQKKKFQTILDKAEVNGAILIYDQQQNKYYSNNFQKAKEPFLPASTFKIPHSIIGLETGILKDEKTIFKWDGNNRASSDWEKDLSLKDAFQKSCVPCYRELARKTGTTRMIEKLKELKFGKMDVKDENIDLFWLTGKSEISPFQQIDFLTRFYNSALPIKSTTLEVVKDIMKIKKTKNYILSGKTGLAVSGEKDTGWFVGYLEIGKKVYYFATIIKPIENNMERKEFIKVRKKATYSALKEMNLIQ